MTRTATDAWSLADIPDQAGRTILVTGTTVGGLGHHTALELARRGGRVVLAGRTQARLDETAATIRDEVPAAALEQLVVDLSDLGSVRRAAGEAAAYGPIDVLVNNAGRDGHGLPADRRRARAADGDQPLRPVPADRAAVPAARRQRGRDRGDGVLALPPDGPVGAARRPDREGRPYGSGAPTRRPSCPTCCSPTSSTAAPARPGCRSRRWPRTPVSPAPTSPPTASTAGRRAASRRSSTPRSRRCLAVGGGGRLADADGGDGGPAGRDVRRPGRPRRDGRRAPGGDVHRSLAGRRDQRRLWELSERTTGVSYP